ncbi:MFS transporter [Pseudomonas sp. NBRC 100443]|uniref:MFS transporter n=1 Tax=Pseudomonas sp. NBRC 100443 TaxID=1113665 RepID=UPI0024A3AF81|nr:MFS transporter [Pseudomonas sp. NBRC 100443]GLU37624.1 MFS transporter [Pseudomonas sp. NBRC 100443]
MRGAISRKLGVLTFSTGVLGGGSLVMVGLQPALQASGFSVAEAAALVTAFSLSFALAAPLGQVLIGHLPRRSVIIAGLCLLALGCLLCAGLDDHRGVFLARLLSGVGAGLCSPMSSALAAGLVPERERGLALARVFSGVTLANVLAAPLAVTVAAQGGWRLAMAGLGALALLAAMLVAVLIPDAERGRRLSPAALAEVLGHRPSLLALLGNVAQVSAIFASFTLVAPLMMQRWGCDAASVSAALLGFGLAGMLGNLWVRRLALRHSALRLGDAASLAFLLAFALLGGARVLWPLGALALLTWALAQDVFYPSQQRRMVELQPTHMGLALALNSSALFLGMSAGSALGGLLAKALGLWAVPWMSLGLVGVAQTLSAASRRQAARAAAPQAAPAD